MNPKKQVKIAVVGKYIDLQDAYKSIYESLTHAAASQDCGIDLKLIDAETLQDGVDGQLKDVAGVLDSRADSASAGSKEKFARRVSRANTRFPISVFVSGCRSRRLSSRATFAESKKQIARSSTKMRPDPVICLLEEQRDVQNKGASMRLGTWPTKITQGTLAEKLYGNNEVLERHRHRYEFNMKYREQHEGKGVHDFGNFTRRLARRVD